MTGTVASPYNYRELGGRLHEECTQPFEQGFRFSGPLCDAMDKCLALWHERWSGLPRKAARKSARKIWAPWRTLASANTIQQRDRADALGNNYDGRNPINR